MAATATIRSAGSTDNAAGDVASALIADIVAGELAGPITGETWRAVGLRYEAPAAALRLAAIELHELGLLTVDCSRLRVAEHESWRLFAPAVLRELDQPRGREAIAAYMDARRLVETDLSSLAARRRGMRDVIELTRARASFSASAAGSGQLHVPLQNYRAAEKQLRRTIARASHNRYLAQVSARLRSRVEEADWLVERALTCPVASAVVTALIDAVRRGDIEQAADSAQAEIDLIESWVWRRLSGSDRS